MRKQKKISKKIIKNHAEFNKQRTGSIDSSNSVDAMHPQQQDGNPSSNGEAVLAMSVVKVSSIVISATVLSEGE